MTLSNIPASLDGSRIFCEFTAGTTVATAKAKLTVIPKPTEAPTEAPTEEATQAPTEAPKPTDAPTEAPVPTPEKADDVVPSEDNTPKGNNALLITVIISVAAVSVAGIAAFVILKLYGKKK